jgi:prephenate dehydrogenase (NADP+)
MTHLALIGGGNMAQYSASALSEKVDQISVYDPHMSPEELHEGFDGIARICTNPGDAVRGADFVLYCVPTDNVQEAMGRSLSWCKPGAIISGQTSRKTPEKLAFDKYVNAHPDCGLEMVTIHTMCNPRNSDPSNEILAIVPDGGSAEAYDKAGGFYGGMSNHVEHYKDIAEHDSIIAYTQVNTSRTNLSIVSAFAGANCFPWMSGSYGGGLDVMELSIAIRSASLPAHIFGGIQFGNEYGQNLVAMSANVGSALRVMVNDPAMFGDDLEEAVFSAKKKLFGDKERSPILKREDVERFRVGDTLPNSHVALMLYALDDAEKGRKPFAYMKGTTPVHTALLCFTDFLFNQDGLLEESLEAIRSGVTQKDDAIFFSEWLAWEEAIRLQERWRYDMQHTQMRERLDALVSPDQKQKYLDTSKEVVAVCRQRMKEAISSGKIEVPAEI